MFSFTMLQFGILFLFTYAIASTSTVVDLRSDNWEALTKGKSIWVKFCTETCQHCNQMHIAWERLGDEFVDNDKVTIGRVHCDREIDLCKKFEILGTPTLLYGNPYNLLEYGGDKDFMSLKAWAVDVLVPICSPDNLDPCSDLEREQILQWMNLSEGDLQRMIEDFKNREETAHRDFEAKMQELQVQYDSLNKKNTQSQARIRTEIKLIKEFGQYRNTRSLQDE